MLHCGTRLTRCDKTTTGMVVRPDEGNRVKRIYYISLLALGVGASFGLCPGAQAEDARVLPVGHGRFSVVYAQSTGISQTFDSGGHAESLTAPYNIDLSSGNLKSFDPRFADLVDGLNELFPGVRYNPQQR